MFLTSANLHGISHGFFTRNGGVSRGIYASLNCGRGSNDIQEHVIENCKRVAEKLGTDSARLLSVYQIHGSDVIVVDAPWANASNPKADAMVTKTPGIALGILTADCVPVLFADKIHGVIGAAHAGWKGTLAGVLQNTISAMCKQGAALNSISVAIGPCIGYASYEVSTEFKDTFLSHDPGFYKYFRPTLRAAHSFFDIRSCVREILVTTGINDINTLENDTYIEEDSFFSFRRTTHRKEPDYGRQVSAIMLNP